MKLLRSAACHSAADGGNVKGMTVMGDALMEGLSDAGSIPARSTFKQNPNALSSDFFMLPLKMIETSVRIGQMQPKCHLTKCDKIGILIDNECKKCVENEEKR